MAGTTTTNHATATLTITGNGVPQNTVTNTATRTGQTEYNSQPTTTSNTVYIPQVNIYAENYPWWWNSDTQTSQYEYVVGNIPPITLDIWNLGPDDATGVIYTYTIGKGLKYEGNSADQGTVTYNNNQLTWNIGNIANGGDTMMKIFVRVLESGTQTPDLTTTANLTHVDQYYTNTIHNNATCKLTTPPGEDTAVTQNTYTGTDGKQYVTYTITATNNGPDNATGVQITDKLPTGLTYTTSTPPTGTTYTNTNGLWNIGTLNNGETKTLTITAQITKTTGTIKNTATLTNTNEYDWNYTNNHHKP